MKPGEDHLPHQSSFETSVSTSNWTDFFTPLHARSCETGLHVDDACITAAHVFVISKQREHWNIQRMSRLHNVIKESPVRSRRTPEHLITQEYQRIRLLLSYTLHHLSMCTVAFLPKLNPRCPLLITDNCDPL